MTDILNLRLGFIEQTLKRIEKDYGIEAAAAAARLRPELWQILQQLNTPINPLPPTFGKFTTQGKRILYQGKPFKFVGANMRELAWYGEVMPHARAEHLETQLDGAKAMGVQVIRYYAPHHTRNVQQAIKQSNRVLSQAHIRGLFCIVVLTDGVHSGFHIADNSQNRNDHEWDHESYTHAFYEGGYKQNYLPFVDVFTRAIGDHPAIFSYEIANELTTRNLSPTIPQMDAMLEFFSTASTLIRLNAPHTLISTGLITCWELFVLNAYGEQIYTRKLYDLPNIDIATIHTYQDMQAPNEPLGTARANIPAELAIIKKPVIIEETDTLHYLNSASWLDTLLNATAPHISGFMHWNMSFPYKVDIGVGDGLMNMGDVRWDRHYEWYQALSAKFRTGV